MHFQFVENKTWELLYFHFNKTAILENSCDSFWYHQINRPKKYIQIFYIPLVHKVNSSRSSFEHHARAHSLVTPNIHYHAERVQDFKATQSSCRDESWIYQSQQLESSCGAYSGFTGHNYFNGNGHAGTELEITQSSEARATNAIIFLVVVLRPTRVLRLYYTPKL